MNADDRNILARARVATRLPAQDLDRARRFYSEQLGLEAVDERPGGLLSWCAGAEFVLFQSTGASGQVRFPEYGNQLYRPDAGAALVFSCAHLHEVREVTAGRRLVLLSFLYGEPAWSAAH